MPSSSAAEDKVTKRASRERATAVRGGAPRKKAATSAVRKRASRKRSSSAETTASTRVSSAAAEPLQRKAPTPLKARQVKSKARRNQLIVIGVILAVGIGASAAIGVTDQGQIDVNRAIEERNARIQSGQLSADDTQRVIVPVQNTAANKLPDGGLIGLSPSELPPPPPPEPEPASTTASTTEDTLTEEDDEAGETAETQEVDAETTTATTEDESTATSDDSAATEEGDDSSTEEEETDSTTGL